MTKQKMIASANRYFFLDNAVEETDDAMRCLKQADTSRNDKEFQTWMASAIKHLQTALDCAERSKKNE